ncbi:mechanosensitive ion channel [Aestuariirhabdus sp. Z084]|uniref:mechanosensitive ion channel domain-containing protein n=1 Tax=Aestuariirhabdus haliotis TaxID=2918751 RepID=UPI00201B3B3D|nr:mechanosensitive ion channel domain-containing protein [Aestuariirhabdus haliotis]MCL6416869.1 mechanosensitive ion channel [Aestuariirhabdus haliotis]MCL6420855.1 mechanosensitive ion channel [Aestuariirhabdus haliotis]
MKQILRIITLLLILPAYAASPQDPPIEPALSLNVQELNPGWWSVIESLQGNQRISFINNIRDYLEQEYDALDNPEVIQNRKVIDSILDRLSRPNNATDSQIELPTPKDQYSIREWLELHRKNSHLTNEISFLRDEQKRVDNIATDLRSTISESLIEYRAAPTGSQEKLVIASQAIRYQLELLLKRSEVANLRQTISTLQKNEQKVSDLLEYAEENLTPTPKQLAILEKKISTIKSKIEKNNLSAYQKKIDELSTKPDNDKLAKKIRNRIRSLEDYANAIDLNSQLIVTQLELSIELGLSGQPMQLPHPVESAWEALGSQILRLNSQFTELLSLLRNADDIESETSFTKTWSRLGKGRQFNYRISLRSAEIQYLLASYKKIALQQRSWWNPEKFFPSRLILLLTDSLGDAWEYPLFSVNQSPVTPASISWFLLIFLLGLVLSYLLRRGLSRLAEKRTNVSESALFTIGKIFHYIIISIALILGFSALGIDFSNLAIIAGALGVGIGFGLQSIFNNFISGLILLFERPLKVGDLVELESGVRGRIKAINVRSTQISTWDNIDILVPNSEFISGRVTNYTYTNDLRRLHIPFGVAYGSDKEKVKSAVIEAALNQPLT